MDTWTKTFTLAQTSNLEAPDGKIFTYGSGVEFTIQKNILIMSTLNSTTIFPNFPKILAHFF
jgi:hypothetical protein